MAASVAESRACDDPRSLRRLARIRRLRWPWLRVCKFGLGVRFGIAGLCYYSGHQAWVSSLAKRSSQQRTRICGKGALHDHPTGGTVLDSNLVELHTKYNDAMIEYTTQNYDWVQQKKYSTDTLLTPEQQDEVWQASRQRLFRYPRLEPRDTHRVTFGRSSPQRFVSASADPEATGDPGDNVFVINLPRRPAKLRHALHELHREGISATIVDAIDGDTFVSQEEPEILVMRHVLIST